MADYPQESVYALVQPPPVPVVKPKRHISCHKGNLPPTNSMMCLEGTRRVCGNLGGKGEKTPANTKKASTFGIDYPKKTSQNRPAPQRLTVDPLKKVMKQDPESLKKSNRERTKMKPAIISKDDKPLQGLCSKRNYIVTNAVDAILAVPTNRVQEPTLSMHGESYGKVPQYLQDINAAIAEEKNYIEAMMERQRQEEMTMRPLGMTEQDALINALKGKWDAINTNYQVATHKTILDTVGARRQKETCEKQMTEVEKAIEKIKRQNILIDLAQ